MLISHPKLQPVLTLLNRYQTSSLCLVAIDGFSAAGKSTLAQAIGASLPCVEIVHMDDFYRPMDEDERAGLDAEGGYRRYYEWERLEAQVLQPLAANQETRYQKYDWTTNRLGQWATVRPNGVVLVEGCYAARPELKHYYDVVLLLETSAARRLERQHARADATEVWLARWDAAERLYMEQYQPQKYADLIIAGE